MRWIDQASGVESVQAIAKEVPVSPLVAKVLVQRGLNSVKQARDFLYPKLAHLEDPFLITGMDVLIDRLLVAIDHREDVAVVGDYDVDGVTSTCLLVKLLRKFGLSPRYYIPVRGNEGYGLSEEMIDRVLADGQPDLLIALDCGTNAVVEIDRLAQLGVAVAVVDHHRHTGEGEPLSHGILVNPHVWDGEGHPWSQLCTVGLTFKVLHALFKRLRERGDERVLSIKLSRYMDLVAMGTVADMMPLWGENRIFVRYGLKVINACGNPGVLALREISGIAPDHQMTSIDVSFRLAPRINASGRLADAALPVELLLAEGTEDCEAMAAQLDSMNQERQSIEKQIYLEAKQVVEEQFEDSAGYVLFDESWHTGVVGIVAGRLCRDFQKPTLVLGMENGKLKGSARSTGKFSLMALLESCDDYLEAWGGHPMAAGVSLDVDQLPAFREAFAQAVVDSKMVVGQESELPITAWLTAQEVCESLMDHLELLEPFGQKHAQPVFGIARVRLSEPAVLIGQGKAHCRFDLPEAGSESPVTVLGWNQGENPPPVGEYFDIAVKLNWNFWRGRKYLQLEMMDWRLSVGG